MNYNYKLKLRYLYMKYTLAPNETLATNETNEYWLKMKHKLLTKQLL
jgi:hypothetical protein